VRVLQSEYGYSQLRKKKGKGKINGTGNLKTTDVLEV
jgi:hypothetical protein